MSGTGNIFGKQGGNLSEEKLQAYLEGKLSAEEQREVEAFLADDGMESDALEGLEQLDKQERRETVQHLNLQLNRYLTERRRQRKGFYKDNKWTMLAIFIVLFVVVLAYIILRLAAS
ncbi:MAG TPA: hypothetical protein VL093_07155 [Flavipsychrobacter sp.]|jgi:hypothetical protein|nr:hypothetical protein [Flavipsychrobacter sp.]